MPSIKDKVAKMIALANGGLITRYHAVRAGIFVEDFRPTPVVKEKKRQSEKKQS